MLKGIDITETIVYTSTNDTGEEKTKFYIGNVSNRDKLKIFSEAINADGTMNQAKLQDKTFDIIKAGIKKIVNLGGKDYSTITDEIIDSLQLTVVVELMSKIIEFNFAGATEIKN